MAKVNAPLLSFEARGQIAKAVVHFPWKGINAVRQYVIPANPQSADQTVQRNFMTDAVAEWHGMTPTAADVIAWNRYAGTLAKIMSGYNAFVKSFLDEAILGNTWERLWNLQLYGATDTTIECDIGKVAGGNAPTILWGTRKTHFPNSAVMADVGGGYWRYSIPGLTASTLYYVWIHVGSSGTDYGRTGIGAQRTTA